MLEIVKGDLLRGGCDIIGHQANCQSVMNSGIAKQIRKEIPDAYKGFISDGREPKEKLGSYSFGRNYTNMKLPYLCYNLYGQLHFGRFNVLYTDYHALAQAITLMLNNVRDRERGWRNLSGGSPRMQPINQKLASGKLLKVGLPYGIGCGLANGDWTTVMDIIETISNNFGRTIHLYQL